MCKRKSFLTVYKLQIIITGARTSSCWRCLGFSLVSISRQNTRRTHHWTKTASWGTANLAHGGQHFLVLRESASWRAKAGKNSLSASKLRANGKKNIYTLPVIFLIMWQNVNKGMFTTQHCHVTLACRVVTVPDKVWAIHRKGRYK